VTAGIGLDDPAADDRALFVPAGPPAPASARVLPSDYGRGPWDHGLLHGGPVVGLAAWAAERLVARSETGPLLCARLTVELLRGVPADELEVAATVAKAGRRATVVDVTVHHDAKLIARATSQWLARSDGWDSDGPPAPARPEVAAVPDDGDFDYPRPGFNCDAAELRYVTGSNEESGPGVIWARLTSPLLAGVTTSPFVALATLADLAAAAGFERGPDDAAFINADITLQLNRYPIGDWIALDARNHRARGSVAFNEAHVYDDRGGFGRILQSLVEAPSAPGAA